MSTIDSLDLATLTNNPSDIAEALEDALETTSSTIGQLKIDAQDLKDDISALKTSAQADHDAIEALLGVSQFTYYDYDDFTVSAASGWTLASTDQWKCATIGDLVFMQFGIYDTGQALDAATTYHACTFTEPSAIIPSSDVTIFTSSSNYQGEQAGSLIFYSNGELHVQFPLEVGDSVHRVFYNFWYKLP